MSTGRLAFPVPDAGEPDSRARSIDACARARDDRRKLRMKNPPARTD
jgi:hypothetical protein